MARSKPKKTQQPKPKEAAVPDLDEHHLSQCLARVGDPMTRYLLCMMLDRLTQQISAFERGEAARTTESNSNLN